MEELMQKLSGYLDAAEGVLKEYGPQAMDAALFVVRFEAIYSLILSVVLLGISWMACRDVVRSARKVGEAEKARDSDASFGWGMRAGAVGVLGSIAFLVLSINGAMLGIFSAYNWLAAFDPMLGLVYKAAQSAGLL